MTYPFLVATSYELCPHRGGMADVYISPAVEQRVVLIINNDRQVRVGDDGVYVARISWRRPPPGLAELVLEIAS